MDDYSSMQWKTGCRPPGRRTTATAQEQRVLAELLQIFTGRQRCHRPLARERCERRRMEL
jgi:hypothetical protein